MPLSLVREGLLAAPIVGTLGDYVVTTNDAGDTLELRAAATFDTVLWSTPFDAAWMNGDTRMGLTSNDCTTVYALHDPGFPAAYRMKRLTLAPGPSINVEDMYDVARGNFFRSRLCNDGSQILMTKFGADHNMYGIDAETGASVWTWDMGGSIGGGFIAGFPAPGRVVVFNWAPLPGTDVALIDTTTNTVLDTLTVPFEWGPVWTTDAGPGTSLFVLDYNDTMPITFKYNMIDYDPGTDSLSLRNATWGSVQTDWTDAWFPMSGTHGSLMGIGPQTFVDEPPPPISAYVIDFANDVVHGSEPNVNYGHGVSGIGVTGTHVVFQNIYWDPYLSTAFLITSPAPPTMVGDPNVEVFFR